MPLVLKKEVGNDTTLAMWKITEPDSEFLSGLQLKQHELDVINALSGKRLTQ